MSPLILLLVPYELSSLTRLLFFFAVRKHAYVPPRRLLQINSLISNDIDMQSSYLIARAPNAPASPVYRHRRPQRQTAIARVHAHRAVKEGRGYSARNELA